MKKILIILGVLLIAAFFLNPSAESHQSKIVDEFKSDNRLINILESVSDINISDISKLAVERDNYYFFSIGKVKGIDKSVSIGLFGYVYVYADLSVLKNIQN